ncbi:putative thioredoxin reductase glit-like protein [Delitschia confertaspora ATCC 74209]|uniref:Thioredoxin reductase glit-like protein n=1 Tax=Delitschia confertaspora ATCC 74209 TaxID=1513339 RepID=A0A9P4MSV3_9PLEO|nr:putative thioredoxin reductase glit-like protein [Delitschia confertaspora ATCC 74209]
MSSVDVIIVGGGPAGLAAALCLSRACYKTAIFDSEIYRNAQASHMHMFPTWDHKDPKEYRAAAKAELLKRYPDFVNFVKHRVTLVKKTAEGAFQAVDETGAEWYGKKLILATGVKDILPNISGYDECWSKGIFHCLFCHGHEDRGQKSVGVLAIELMAQVPMITNGLIRNALQFSETVTVYTNSGEAVANTLSGMIVDLGDHVKIDNRHIVRFIKEPTGAAVTIEFDDGSKVTEGFLVHGPRNEMALEFAKDLNLEKMPSGGELKVTPPFNETTEPGCFAAGDCGSMGKIIVAGVAFGTFAATGIVKQLQGY